MKKIFAVLSVLVLSLVSVSAFAVNENAISEHCGAIKETLVNLQHQDSRTRVYLGRYYETILNTYIVPLNLRLVENNIGNNELMDNQTNFSNKRQEFISDYINYQKDLEDLVASNCESEPGTFYQKLQNTRVKRQTVANDVVKMRSLIKKQVELVKKLKEGITE